LEHFQQASWDRPGIVAIKDELMTTRANPRQKAVLLAAMVTGSAPFRLLLVGCGWTMSQFEWRWFCFCDWASAFHTPVFVEKP